MCSQQMETGEYGHLDDAKPSRGCDRVDELLLQRTENGQKKRTSQAVWMCMCLRAGQTDK